VNRRINPGRGRSIAKRVLLYGATGYTGGLIAREAVARGMRPVLAGRDVARLSVLGRELECETRVASLDQPRALALALQGIDALVNAAGPFSATARPLVEACLELGAHYLDIGGEVDTLAVICGYDTAAKRAGVMLMPGVGFDVVPSDCLVARVTRRLPSASRLAIGISGLELVSRGSARTIAEQMGKAIQVRRNGELTTVGSTLETSFDFGLGLRPSVCVSWGDVVTAFHATGIPNIEVYFEATPAIRAFQLLGQTWQFPPAALFSRFWMQAWIEAQPDGPTPSERARRQAVIVARAEAEDGRYVVSRARTPEVYTFTAASAALSAARVLEGELEPGFQTPASVFGESFLSSFEGVTVEDVSTVETSRRTPDQRGTRR
jgi:short subunit dehydrogenase-like uncharacterized protein